MDSSTDVFMLKNQYLDLLSQDSFIIIFKNNKYKCNIYGVKSSEVIQELLQKDPNLRQYEYNFDESAENFQIICDFFNFKKIRITTKNMVSIRNIAENLKIDIILTDINNYINSYEDIVQKTDPIIELFDLLYNIKELTVESVKNSIIDSIWVHGEGKVKEFSAYILQAVRSSFIIQPYLADLIILLDKSSDEKNDLHLLKPFLIKQLHFNFFKNRFYCSFVHVLSKSGIISIDQIISQIFLIDPYISPKATKSSGNDSKSPLSEFDKFDTTSHKNVVIWFLAELFDQKNSKEKDLFNSIDSKTSNFINMYWPEKSMNTKKIGTQFHLEVN